MKFFKYKTMRLISLLLFATIAISNSKAQDVPNGYLQVNQFLVPVDLLDTAYPVLEKTGSVEKDSVLFVAALSTYTKQLGRLPNYICTGDVEKDQTRYNNSIWQFLEEHPYFPQPIYSYNKQRDADVFECLWKGYFKQFPEKAKRIIILQEGVDK